jgi:hypothetical protein
MAVRYAVASGNWSNAATWDGGTLPTAADDVYANNRTVTIDTNITVISIRTDASSPAVAGGSFTVSTTRTLNCNVISGNVTSCLTITTGTTSLTGDVYGCTTVNNVNLSGVIINAGATLTFIGNAYNALQASCRAITNSGTVNHTGNLTTYSTAQSNFGFLLSNNGTYNLTGNINLSAGGNTSGGGVFLVNNSGTLTINGNISGNGINFNAGVYNQGSPAVVNITGSITLNRASGAPPVQNSSTGTINIYTDQVPLGNYAGYPVENSSLGTVNINANVLGALSGSPSLAYYANNVGLGTININGDVTARSVSPSTTIGLINNAAAGTINVSGSITGGSVANTIGISNTSTGTINVTGNVTGGSNATNTPAINITQAGTITLNGNATSGSYPAIFSTVTTAKFNLLGNVTNVGGVPAYNGSFNIKISPTAAQQFTFQDTSNVNRLIATSNISPGVPAVGNVRFGTVYGSLGEYTGTLRVPNPNTVLLGNLTDNTTGTLLMTPSDFWNAATSGMTTSGSIGERLKNASTVQTTGDQLASYQV